MFPTPPRGRFAPSPTGSLHLGNALSALAGWWSIRSQGGTFVIRMEDLDPPRTVPGCAEEILDDLKWMGIDWDEGPDIGGPFGPYNQSERSEKYDQALAQLAEREQIFPCSYTRRELSVMLATEGSSAYPASLRPAELAKSWLADLPATGTAIRMKVPDERVSFVDLGCGVVSENVRDTVGDFVLKRRDGLYAYQLAVVVDDQDMEITEVIRGNDLLDSTARQILLHRALGEQTPAFGHLPLLVNSDGTKHSKRNGDLSLQDLREAGVKPSTLVGFLAHVIGLTNSLQRLCATDVVPHWSWDKVNKDNQIVETDTLTDKLLAMQ